MGNGADSPTGLSIVLERRRTGGLQLLTAPIGVAELEACCIVSVGGGGATLCEGIPEIPPPKTLGVLGGGITGLSGETGRQTERLRDDEDEMACSKSFFATSLGVRGFRPCVSLELEAARGRV